MAKFGNVVWELHPYHTIVGPEGDAAPLSRSDGDQPTNRFDADEQPYRLPALQIQNRAEGSRSTRVRRR